MKYCGSNYILWDFGQDLDSIFSFIQFIIFDMKNFLCIYAHFIVAF